MLKDKVAALLKVLPQEMRMVALVAALFLFIQAGQGIGENAAFGLFLGRVHVDRLPYMYMGLGVFVALASLAYATSLSRFRDASVVTYLLAIAVFVFLGQWVAIAVFGISFYSILWLTTYGMGVLSGTVLWTIAGAVCDARQAKRLFPLFTTRGPGGFVGEMVILDSAPRSATLRALNDVRVLSIEGDAFKSILLDRPEVAVSALRNMSARIRALNESVQGRRLNFKRYNS